MDEPDVFPHEAADVAMQAVKDGLARVEMSWEAVYTKTEADIKHARAITQVLIDEHLIKHPPQEMLQEALEWAIYKVVGA